ncbi:MAG: GIY-YIG nuclease family protein [Pirellulales bacterium]|nr:GIY-YIG nuclease family protein [Pirellulales bacterium]
MPLTFNMILREAGIPLSNVRLLRHKDTRAAKGRTAYELYRDDRRQFEVYQSLQKINNRSKFKAPYWASFVGTPSDETLFVGLYESQYLGLLKEDRHMPHRDGIDKAGTCDEYQLTVDQRFCDLDGRLLIEWGDGKRSWVQRADRQDKQITELRTEFKEPDFPGFLNFTKPLSGLERLPIGWITALKAAQGIYLLTCPRTKELYVGMADGHDGFWGRWLQYVHTGDGGNKALKRRAPSDYQVSILQVAGTAAKHEDIMAMESCWKQKLQSREMGLNRN